MNCDRCGYDTCPRPIVVGNPPCNLPVLYYEAHITIEPVFDEDLVVFAEACKKFKFKPAKLLMQKDRQDTPVRSNKDTFATGHGKDYNEIHNRAMLLVNELKIVGFKVWRLKIESCVFDEMYDKISA